MDFVKIPIPTSIITVGLDEYNMHFVKIQVPTSIITVGLVL